MTDPTIDRPERVEVITSVQRRRWPAAEKVRIVEEMWLPGASVSEVARRHGVGATQVFGWRRLMAQGALTAAGAGVFSDSLVVDQGGFSHPGVFEDSGARLSTIVLVDAPSRIP